MTREELYNLVWSRPMTHLAKEFGISDVAIRKHCKKLDIATPYVGYWAKLEHGKRVLRPPLSTKKFSADELVDLTPKARTVASEKSSQAAAVVKARLELLHPILVVPDRLSGQLHPLVRLTRERLKQVKADNHGLLSIGNSYCPSISVGPASIQRVLCILSTIRKVATIEGHSLFETDDQYYWRVKDERFVLRIYETKDKSAHEPTRAELSEQARHDKRRKEHPDWYSTDRKAYRTWDYRPSGRLTLELSDSARYGWRDEHVQHRWRDRKTKTLDLCLADVFIWLASAEVTVREKRLKYEEERRIQAAAEEQRRIAKEQHQKAKELERFILELADIQKVTKNVSELQKHMGERQTGGGWASLRLLEELHSYQTHLQSMTDEMAITKFLRSLELKQDTPLLTPYLTTE